MKPVLSHLNEAIEQLTKAGMESPQLDAEVLLAHALGCERHEVYCTPHPPKSWRMLRDPAKPGLDAATTGYLLPYGNLEVFKSYVERRLKNEPIAYIVGYKEFWSLKIKVTPAVLIPRPATENLVEKALEILDHGLWTVNHRPKILDLCTGSGAIAAALAKELPTANIVAADISAEALQVAKENLKFAEDRVTLVQSNLFEKIT
ncbi:MAG: peptide chain release factor N(5)-glutamine methyltransferase, partial [Deltaproteobacteria bacterium]|nr:peptide chain release factor N(5)-glutamine methyltransferase [Deltaproteobacteria bacterium]